jgi:hypothetical protein
MAKIEIEVGKLVNEAFESATKEAKERIYTRRVYDIIKTESTGLDSIYKDFILCCVGTYGLNTLLDANLLEACGVVYGRKLYTLLDWEE